MDRPGCGGGLNPRKDVDLCPYLGNSREHLGCGRSGCVWMRSMVLIVRLGVSSVSASNSTLMGALRGWGVQVQIDACERPGYGQVMMLPGSRALEKENRQLPRANEIWRKTSAYFRPG